MICTVFRLHDQQLTGFTVKGHSGTAARGSDIVCAAVSSAAYMTVNTLTEIIGVQAEIEVEDGYLHCMVSDGNSSASDLLAGFRLHMEQLAEQYPKAIKITTEV
ncbi:MAG: ribosomal-processing cysteine protease Prp [Clostridia bacterium]|nr:ribosomal-processing cysteine protease Prp [Clostridia bacterium]